MREVQRHRPLPPPESRGMGVVHRARDRVLGREVALKVARDPVRVEIAPDEVPATDGRGDVPTRRAYTWHRP